MNLHVWENKRANGYLAFSAFKLMMTIIERLFCSYYNYMTEMYDIYIYQNLFIENGVLSYLKKQPQGYFRKKIQWFLHISTF